MSTKISRGARLHLLRVVERLQYPMLRYVGPFATPKQRKALRDALDQLGRWHICLPGVGFQFITPAVSS
jgi:hypothetical protein